MLLSKVVAFAEIGLQIVQLFNLGALVVDRVAMKMRISAKLFPLTLPHAGFIEVEKLAAGLALTEQEIGLEVPPVITGKYDDRSQSQGMADCPNSFC